MLRSLQQYTESKEELIKKNIEAESPSRAQLFLALPEWVGFGVFNSFDWQHGRRWLQGVRVREKPRRGPRGLLHTHTYSARPQTNPSLEWVDGVFLPYASHVRSLDGSDILLTSIWKVVVIRANLPLTTLSRFSRKYFQKKNTSKFSKLSCNFALDIS